MEKSNDQLKSLVLIMPAVRLNSIPLFISFPMFCHCVLNPPPSGGFRTQWQNIGKDMNNGIELSLTAGIIKTSDFNWSLDFSIAFNKNKLSGFGTDTIITSNSYGVTQVYHNGCLLYTSPSPRDRTR